MMAQPNQEPPQTQSQNEINLTMNQQKQQQQHEFIKLLAQHFKDQFYQSPVIGGNLSESISQNHSIANLMANYHHLSGLSNQVDEATRQQFENLLQLNQMMTTSAKTINPSSVMFNSHNLNALNRSQHLQPQVRVSHPNDLPAPSIADQFSAVNLHNHSLASTSSADVNLFEALGLNLTSNQLVLSSLQHQSLIQAAAVAATASRNQQQYEPRLTQTQLDAIASAAEHQKRVHLHSAPTLTHIMRNHQFSNQQHFDRRQHQHQADHASQTSSEKDSLKFSISTILGGGITRAPSSMRPDNVANKFDNRNTVSNNHQSYLTDRSVDNNQSSVKADDNEDECVEGASNHGNKRANITEVDDLDNESNISDFDPVGDMAGRNSMSPAHMSVGNLRMQSSNDAKSLLTFADATTMNLNHQDNCRITNINHAPFSLALSGIQQPQPPPHSSQLMRQSHGHPGLPFLTSSATFPWTVASRGKPRRGMMRRAVFSDSQRVGLEKRFQLQKYISKPDRKKLAERLGLRDSQVKIWFQNRRMKWRNSKERELLSAGGSREQTLPTRNNPNPDLSDVGETIKKLASGGLAGSESPFPQETNEPAPK